MIVYNGEKEGVVMELFETLLKRRSCRSFLATEVKQVDIDKILHAAMSGPSACNYKPWEFYVVKNETALAELRKATKYSNINGKVAIVVCGNMSKTLPFDMKDYWIEDTSAAIENILLAATALGLGSLWCGVYPQKRNIENVKNILNLKDNIIPLGIVYLGYPEKQAEPRDQYDEKCIHNIE